MKWRRALQSERQGISSLAPNAASAVLEPDARRPAASSSPDIGSAAVGRAGEALVTLQTLLLSAAEQTRPLYYALQSGPSGRGAAVCEAGGGLSLQPGAEVGFDTYFNCFYESVWLEHTVVRDVVLEAETEGPIELLVYRSGHFRVRHLVATAFGEGGRTRHAIKIPPGAKSHLGRLHLEVRATGSTDARLVSARWTTPRGPLRIPRLAIAMCTFNKPAAVAGNVGAVLEAIAEERWFETMIVVDQGDRKVADHPDIAARRHADPRYRKLHIHEQGNFGGAGGFTRGMIEALALPEVTHVTLMDDDVEVEPRVFARLHAFLQFATQDVIVGGQMFDLFSPMIMRTFAEAADYTNLRYFHVGPHSVDFAQPFTSEILNGTPRASYNGWWLCTYPRALIEQHELPLPVFVRCDDSEYSTRMTARGVELVSLPGFMIWHEPFHAKVVAWMMYYETRNFLLLSLLRAGAHRPRTILMLVARIWTFAARGLYDHAEALLMALETFLEGPAWLSEDPRARHLALTKHLKTLAPDVLPEGQRPGFDGDPWHDPVLRGGRGRRFVRSLIHHLAVAPKRPRKDPPLRTIPLHALIWPMLTGKSVLGVFNPHANQTFVLRLNRTIARDQLRRALRLARLWRRNRRDLAEAYGHAADAASTKDAWTRYLGIDVDRLAP